MTIEITHAFECLKSDGPDATVVKPSDWNEVHDIIMAHSFIMGRAEGTDGSVQELPVKVTSGGDVTLTAALGYFLGAVGTTAQRPGTPLAGMERTNVTTTKKEWYDGANWQNLTTESYLVTYVASYTANQLPAGMIYGLTLSTASGGGSTTFSVATGRCVDSTLAALITRAAISKTTGAWAAGNNQGSLDAGTIAINTWYHVYVIAKADLSATDICISTNSSVPTPLPATYTLYRRIGSIKTDASSKWKPFIQNGDYFFIPKIKDADIGAQAYTLTTLSVPLGLVVRPLMFGISLGNSSTAICFIAAADTVANEMSLIGVSASTIGSFGVTGPTIEGPLTNTSSQINIFGNCVGGGVEVYTVGWKDSRGRDG